MNFIKRNFLALMLAMSSAGMLVAADYGLPASIQEGTSSIVLTGPWQR